MVDFYESVCTSSSPRVLSKRGFPEAGEELRQAHMYHIAVLIYILMLGTGERSCS